MQPTANPPSPLVVALPSNSAPFVLPVLALLLCLTVAWVAPHDALSERGLIERASVAMWLVAAVAALFRFAYRSDRWTWAASIWLALFAFAAAAREMHLERALNPEYLGTWGVRFRFDWWVDSDTSVLLRLMWAGIFSTVAVLVAGLVRYTLGAHGPHHDTGNRLSITNLKQSIGSSGWRWLALSFALLILGWGCDDVLRGRLHEIWGAMIEESLELLSAACFIAAVGLMCEKWIRSAQLPTPQAWPTQA
jgi:hypothetical protein